MNVRNEGISSISVGTKQLAHLHRVIETLETRRDEEFMDEAVKLEVAQGQTLRLTDTSRGGP